MKDAFYFILKARFVFKFFVWVFWSHRKNNLIKKVNFKVYDVAYWFIVVTILMLPYISRRKGNQIIKFGQLIEYK